MATANYELMEVMVLMMISRIMMQHNGSVKVKSEPGVTEFEICFPIN